LIGLVIWEKVAQKIKQFQEKGKHATRTTLRPILGKAKTFLIKNFGIHLKFLWKLN
jgi:hypothetical protein